MKWKIKYFKKFYKKLKNLKNSKSGAFIACPPLATAATHAQNGTGHLSCVLNNDTIGYLVQCNATGITGTVFLFSLACHCLYWETLRVSYFALLFMLQ